MTLSEIVPIYARSTRKTRLAMRRKKTRWGALYRYSPRADLVKNCMKEFNWTEKQVRDQIVKEVRFLRENPWMPLDLLPGE